MDTRTEPQPRPPADPAGAGPAARATGPVATALVDVVILTWNDGELLEHALSSVRASTGTSVAAIVVDNGSSVPVEPGADVTLVRNDRNAGVAPGRNQGVLAGAARYVCLLDSDAQLEPDTIAKLVTALEDAPDVGLVAPIFVGQAPEASGGRAPTFGRKVLRAAGLSATYRSMTPAGADAWDVEFTIGACQLFRRAAFDAVGGLDGTIFYGPEDVDFCLRLRAAGWRVRQVGTALCHHPPRRRNRALFTRRGLAHGRAVLRHLWRHRRAS